MTQDLWTAVDNYISETLLSPDVALDAAVKASDSAGLPSIQVSAAQGKLLEILVRIHGAKRVLEVGTLGGYSTIWMARALPADGRLITIEIDPAHAEVATANIENAGLSHKVEVLLGNAHDILPRIAARNDAPLDLSFIDADKPSIPVYFDWAKRMSRPGSVIIVDNVVREGAVIEADSDDPAVQGVRRLNEMMAADPMISATVLQTVGVKGYDGFSIARITG